MTIINKNTEQKEFRFTEKLMGNIFGITVVSDHEPWANEKALLAMEEIRRIEKLLTTFSEDSQTNQVNRMAGINPVPVDQEVFDLIKRSLTISSITDGAFDITYGSIDKSLWNFDRSMTRLPDAETAKSMVRLIDYRNVILDETNRAVFLKNSGMRIGFGGIGKGYAAEKAKSVLLAAGVESGIVNASGDLAAWGMQPNGKEWTIGISDPDQANQPFSYLSVTDKAIATSGSYEKFVMIDGKRYSHTINPKTGLPVTGIKSVTIISSNAEFSDALATPVTVMGVNAGLNLINQLPNVACVIIDDSNKLYTSKNIRLS